MRTYYPGDAEVDAYLRDIAARFAVLEPNYPHVWCAIGPSGRILARRLLKLAAELTGSLIVVRCDRMTHVNTIDTGDPAREIGGKDILVLDSSVHSGNTMLGVVRDVAKLKPKSITTYSLILKRSSAFVPTCWGLTIGDHDRAYFLLKRLPNNRLHKTALCRHLRLLTEADLGVPPVKSGLESMDRITWADRYYDMRCSDRERRTYLLEVGDAIVGYVTFALKVLTTGDTVLFVDEIAVAGDQQNKGYAGTLMRWAETSARNLCCSEMRLWGIREHVDVYAHLGFEVIVPEATMTLDGEVYIHMRKRVIYHIKPRDE
jgi:GNAT superfamily N-acetyltransferase